MAQAKEKLMPEQTRGGYSDEEVASIYELGRIYLENGNLSSAQIIFQGLSEVVPDFAPAWLGLCYVELFNNNIDAGLEAAKNAHASGPDSAEAMLFMIACLLSVGDYHAAGSYLGEVSEMVEGGAVSNPSLVRFFKAQLARYQAR